MMSERTCPICGRTSLEITHTKTYCLYASCDYRKEKKTVEERLEELEWAVNELWGKVKP